MRIPALFLAAALLAAPAAPALATVPLPPILAPDLATQRDVARPAPPPTRAAAPVEAPAAATSNDWSDLGGPPAAPVGIPGVPKPPKAGGAQAGAPAKAAAASKFMAPLRAAWQAYQAALARRDGGAVANAWAPKFTPYTRTDLARSNPDAAANWRSQLTDLIANPRFISAEARPVAAGSDWAGLARDVGITVRPGDGTMVGNLVLEGTHAAESEHHSKGSYARLDVQFWRTGGKWRIGVMNSGM